MAVDFFNMRINAVCYCVHHQMADVTAVFFTDTFDGIIFGINDFIVRANLRQERYDSFAQFSLRIFANEYSWTYEQILAHYFGITSGSSHQLYGMNW